MTFRKGLTLVELLVVVGIIAILAGVLLVSFGGATDSARAAQCLTNMRALAMAVNGRAIATGRYPIAGSVELETLLLGGGNSFRSQPGWISWLCEGNYDDGNGNAVSSSHCSNPIFPFYGRQDEHENSFALTNGSTWVTCNRNRALYTCPEHVRFRKERGYSSPHFSYVMNARFGWDHTKGGGSIPSAEDIGIVYGTLTKADKTLMFAELPTVVVGSDSGTEKESPAEPTELKADCVLQYLKVGDDSSVYASDGTDAESIGFVHADKKGKRYAHLAFADGHTEKLVWISGGLEPKELTAYLCRGIDVAAEASGWTLPSNADDSDDEEE